MDGARFNRRRRRQWTIPRGKNRQLALPSKSPMNSRAAQTRMAFLASLSLATTWLACSGGTSFDAAQGPVTPAVTVDEEPESEPAASAARDGGKDARSDAKREASTAVEPDESDAGAAGLPDAASCWPFPCSMPDASKVDAAPAEAGTCKSAPRGTVTTSYSKPGFAPTLAGGALVDGDYKLTARNRYGSTGSVTVGTSKGIRVEGSTITYSVAGFGTLLSCEYTFTKSGTNKLFLQQTCPAPSGGGVPTWTYETDGATLVVRGALYSSDYDETFERL